MHITTLFHAHNNTIPYILQLYSMHITTLFHAYNNSIPYILQLYSMHITTLFHTYYKSIPCTYNNSIPCGEVKKKKKERGGGEGGRERDSSLFTRVIDSMYAFSRPTLAQTKDYSRSSCTCTHFQSYDTPVQSWHK